MMITFWNEYLIHGREVKPEVGEEGEGELEAGVEKEVEEISPADRSEASHVGIANILQRGKLKMSKVKMWVKFDF